MGTHTSNNDPNYLMIVKVKVPSSDANEKIENDSKEPDNKIEIAIKINHEGEVNRARHMPQASKVIATKTNKGEVHIFDYF